MPTPEAIVAIARGYVGTPFRHQGRLPGLALDCAGVVVCVAKELGLEGDFKEVPYGKHPHGNTLQGLCDQHMDRTPMYGPGDVLLMAWEAEPQHLAIASDIGIIHNQGEEGSRACARPGLAITHPVCVSVSRSAAGARAEVEGRAPRLARDLLMAVLAIAAVGAVAGRAIGAPFGAVALGASIGWAVGSFVGQLAFGPDPPSSIGPRLQDLNVQSSAEGMGIPIVFGRARIAGNVIWARPIQETRHEEEVGGKGMGGGGTQVSYTYSVSFAIGLCEGQIAGDAGTLHVSQELAKSITAYTGSESQTADPTIQSFEGVANTPAYRGLAYLVFEDLQLADFANHMPNITCEVLSVGSVQGLRLLTDTQTAVCIPAIAIADSEHCDHLIRTA